MFNLANYIFDVVQLLYYIFIGIASFNALRIYNPGEKGNTKLGFWFIFFIGVVSVILFIKTLCV